MLLPSVLYMKNIFAFLVKHSTFLLFLLLEGVALLLVVMYNQYPKSVVFSSCNVVTASLLETTNEVAEYFRLDEQNSQLIEENVALRNQINDLQNQLAFYQDSVNIAAMEAKQYAFADKNITYISAKVIHTSLYRQHNYLTINKGLRDGVMKDMGVIDERGVVGIVCGVSEHFALVIPLIHTSSSISSKFKYDNYVGILKWNGEDIHESQLTDISRHMQVNIGDTIVTSGLSTIFPPDIPIGIITNTTLTDFDAYYHIDVRLAVDYKRMGYVSVIQNHNLSEQKALQASYQ